MPIEIRCPACLPLGYSAARLAFVVHGVMVITEVVKIQFHCKRCKSVVQWLYSTTEFETIKLGERNHKPMKASFE